MNVRVSPLWGLCVSRRHPAWEAELPRALGLASQGGARESSRLGLAGTEGGPSSPAGPRSALHRPAWLRALDYSAVLGEQQGPAGDRADSSSTCHQGDPVPPASRPRRAHLPEGLLRSPPRLGSLGEETEAAQDPDP